MWDPQLPGPRSAAETGPWTRVGRVVSGLCHVSLLLGGEGSRHPAWGWGSCFVGNTMRKFSCAVPCGSAVVAERQGEGSHWLDPAQPYFGAGAACSHPGMLCGDCVSRTCMGRVCSCCTQLWFKAGLTAL